MNIIDYFCVTLLSVSNICNVYTCFSGRNSVSVQMGHLEGKESNRKCLKPSRTWLKSSGIFPGWRWTICWTSNKILAAEHSKCGCYQIHTIFLKTENSDFALYSESWAKLILIAYGSVFSCACYNSALDKGSDVFKEYLRQMFLIAEWQLICIFEWFVNI